MGGDYAAVWLGIRGNDWAMIELRFRVGVVRDHQQVGTVLSLGAYRHRHRAFGDGHVDWY
jgi:hypothetical protein